MELAPGVLAGMLGKLSAKVEVRAPLALTEVAKLIEDRAIQSVAARTHSYRTPTPASRGGPPASISGTLAKSITHTTVKPGVAGWEIRVGLASGMYPPYRSRTSSSMYGKYLETSGAGRSHVRYPFLLPAFHAVALHGAYAVFKAAFAGSWL